MMDISTFCQSYMDLAYQALADTQKYPKIECEYERIKHDSKRYVDYLAKFVPFFEVFPVLKTELFNNLTNCRFGAFIEYQLDLLHSQLRKIEELKTEIQREITGLRNDFADESKEWLPKEEGDMMGCFHYIETANIQQAIGFLTDRLLTLNTRKDSFLLERKRMVDAAEVHELQPDDNSSMRAKQEKEEMERIAAEKQRIDVELRAKALAAFKRSLQHNQK